MAEENLIDVTLGFGKGFLPGLAELGLEGHHKGTLPVGLVTEWEQVRVDHELYGVSLAPWQTHLPKQLSPSCCGEE